MGTATKKLLMSHSHTSMYLYGDLEGGICFMSIEIFVRVRMLIKSNLLLPLNN